MNAIIRGAGRCPRCGKGDFCIAISKLWTDIRYVVTYVHFRTDDAPPWLTILIVGHITVPIILAIEGSVELSLWAELAIYLPLIILLTLAILPRCKGVILALLWVTKAEGSEQT